ncbi:MAG: gliding motility-associated C-terminal domain-containing protein [Bacteroidia bacterium]
MSNRYTLYFIVSFLLFFLLNGAVFSQTDTEFWFVAPEVTSGHSDDPIVLRVSSLTQDANIQISQPANPSFPIINATIPTGQTQTFDLTAFKSTIENTPVNTVLNYGILLEASVPVTAYYEVNAQNNPDIFSLKGSNAKGTEFLTPFQTFFENGIYSPIALSGFDIVSTEDNNSITITPSIDIQGHTAGVPFTVVLNAGQTYSCLATGISTNEHPAGSRITSTKPICVTIKDDSMRNGNCRDLMGDQIVPISVIGTEYIVMRGFLSSTEYAFVLATEDATEVSVGGNLFTTLNTAETAVIPISTIQPTTYISTSSPVYVLHVAGFGCEMGGALLPSIECTGSNTVFFTRSTSELFGLNIMVRNGSQNNFVLNGDPLLIPGSLFNVVPGTNNVWTAAQVSLNESQVPVGTTSALTTTATNDELFHLGIINGGANSGCRYGYFSDFSSTNLGGNRIVCTDDTLELDAGPNKDSYLWSTGDTTQVISVIDAGTYWVTTVKGGCEASDTVTVIGDEGLIDLGPDTTVCGNVSIELNAGNGFTEYLWSNGETASSISVNQADTYIVEAFTFVGCVIRDTIVVTAQEIPEEIIIEQNSPICEGETLLITAQNAIGEISWTGPQNFSSNENQIELSNITSLQGGTYTISQLIGECVSPPLSVEIIVNELPETEIIGDTLLCEGELTALEAINGPFDSYLWSNGETTSAIIDLGASEYWVQVSLNGCLGYDTLTVYLDEPIANFTIQPDTIVFLGTPFEFTDISESLITENISYIWDFDNGSFSDGESVIYTYPDTGDYQVIFTVINVNECLDTLIRNVSVIREIIIPNAFSPNGDGFNDFFVVKYLEVYPNSELLIFNRWGNKIYENADYKNDWDGENQPDGTYFYVLNLGNGEQSFKGSIFLNRD